MSEFKVGDKVKVVRKQTLEERLIYSLWLNEMDETVGEISRITSISENGDIELENNYWYPAYTLEKVDKTIDDTPQPICPLMTYYEGDEDRCDTSKCDFSPEERGCSEACKIQPHLVVADEMLEGNPEIKDYLLDKDKIAGTRPQFNIEGVRTGRYSKVRPDGKPLETNPNHTDEELFESKDAMLPGKGISFHKFEKPDCRILKTFDNPQQKVNYIIEISTHELTALCPLTSFPDFYDLKISYKPALKCIESKSAKFYFHSFRDFGGFIETLANRIADDWMKACAPKWLKVELEMAPRGGIPITVVVERLPSDRIE